MANVKVNLNTRGITKKIKRQIAVALKKSEIQESVRKEIIRTIKKGKLPSDKNVKGFEGANTIEQRKRIAKKNPTGEGYRANKSNLTLTGELIEKGLKSVFLVSSFKIRILPKKGKHKLYKRSTKRKKGVRIKSSYADIFKGQSDQGRDVFEFGNKFLKRVSKIVQRELKRVLQK